MRLIDADKYKGKIIASHCYSGVNKLINVDDVPTAFDLDKLLQQLEENFKPDIECFEYAEDYEYSLERYNRMIEIVKRGGKEQQ